MGPVQGIRSNSGLPDFANRFELPEELPKPILITEEEAQQKLQELGVHFPVLFLFLSLFLAIGGMHILHQL